MSTVVEPASARVKSSESSRDLKGYLEALTQLCTVLDIANKSCIKRHQRKTFRSKIQALNHEYSCRPATERVKSSETSRDLKGYLELLTHQCTVLNIANESCIRSQEITLP